MNKLQRKQSRKQLICENEKIPTCILFTADWCNACKDTELLFNRKKKQFQSKINFKKINVDDDDADCATIQCKIVKIPTLVIINNGKKTNYINEEITEEIFDKCENDTEIKQKNNIIEKQV